MNNPDRGFGDGGEPSRSLGEEALMFSRLKRSRIRSGFLKVLDELGFVDTDTLHRAQEAIDADPESTSEDIVVDHLLLSDEQMQVAEDEYRRRYPQEYKTEMFRKAHTQIEEGKTDSVKLDAVLTALKRKNSTA